MKDRKFTVECNDNAKNNLKEWIEYAKELQARSNNKLGDLAGIIEFTNSQLLIELEDDPISAGLESYPELLTGNANLKTYYCERNGLNIYYDVLEVDKQVLVYRYEWRLSPIINDFFDES